MSGKNNVSGAVDGSRSTGFSLHITFQVFNYPSNSFKSDVNDNAEFKFLKHHYCYNSYV